MFSNYSVLPPNNLIKKILYKIFLLAELDHQFYTSQIFA